MNQLQKVFEYQSRPVRMVMFEGEPWFVAKDVCEILDLGNITETLRRMDKDEFSSTEVVDALGRTQLSYVVSEAGLYRLVLTCRKEEAKAFKRWITHEVLPSIRKHGAYMTPEALESALLNPDTMIKLLTNLKHEQEKRKQAEAIVAQQAPKALFADAVTASKSSVLIGELAKIIKQNGPDIGQNRLFEWLRNEGYLCKSGENKNLPTQYSMSLGLFEIKKTTINNADGSSRVTRTPKVTGKGQIYFVNKFLGRSESA